MSLSDTEFAALIEEARDLSGLDAATLTAEILAPLNPEPLCRVCSGALEKRDLDIGTHAACDPQPRPGVIPPATLPILTDALRTFDAGKARSMQTAIGPSEIGVACDRRLGYAIRNAPKQPSPLPWAPIMGTSIHETIAAALAAANTAEGRERWLIEKRIQPDVGLFGHCDAYDTDMETVVDWKLVGKSTLDKVRRHGPGEQYETQLQIYGRGWQRRGREPRFVRIVFLPRASHRIEDGYEWTAPYSRPAAEKALARLRDVAAMLDSLDVERHPDRWKRVPATTKSDVCYFCPYRRQAPGVDFHGCSGVKSEAAQTVDNYLASLPEA